MARGANRIESHTAALVGTLAVLLGLAFILSAPGFGRQPSVAQAETCIPRPAKHANADKVEAEWWCTTTTLPPTTTAPPTTAAPTTSTGVPVTAGTLPATSAPVAPQSAVAAQGAVSPATASAPHNELPFTGSTTRDLGLLGLGIAAFGLALVFATAKRPRLWFRLRHAVTDADEPHR